MCRRQRVRFLGAGRPDKVVFFLDRGGIGFDTKSCNAGADLRAKPSR
jgi:hypothetical protein